MAAGKPLGDLAPPAGGGVTPPLANPTEEWPGLSCLVLVPDVPDGLDAASAIRRCPLVSPIHVVTGLTRSAGLLRSGSIRTLVATPSDLLELLKQSALSADSIRR